MIRHRYSLYCCTIFNLFFTSRSFAAASVFFFLRVTHPLRLPSSKSYLLPIGCARIILIELTVFELKSIRSSMSILVFLFIVCLR